MAGLQINSDHRNTLGRILGHSGSANIEWRQVLSLLEAVGATTEEHNGKFKVTLGPETEVMHPPRGKDVDEQMLVDLRRMFEKAGTTPSKRL